MRAEKRRKSEAGRSLILLGASGRGKDLDFILPECETMKEVYVGKGPTLAQVLKELSGGLVESVAGESYSPSKRSDFTTSHNRGQSRGFTVVTVRPQPLSL